MHDTSVKAPQYIIRYYVLYFLLSIQITFAAGPLLDQFQVFSAPAMPQVQIKELNT